MKRKQWKNASVAKEILIYFRSPELSSIQTILEGLLTLYETPVILDSRSAMIDAKEPLNSESPFLCFKQRKIMLYAQKAHGSGPVHPKACSVF